MDLSEAAELPDLEDERREDLILVLGRIAMSALSDDDGHQVRLELALLHAEAGRVAEAIELVTEAHRHRPTLATARLWHELAMRGGSPEQAARALEAELQHASSDAARGALEIARGRTAEDESDAEGALRAFSRASALGTRIEAAWAAERVAVSMGRWRDAAEAAEQAARLTSHPEAASEWTGRAARYRLMNDEPDAAATLLRGSSGGVDSPGVWLGWELLAASADAPGAWIDLRRKQLEVRPSAEIAIDAALVARYRLADDALARAFLERALETSEGDARRFVLAELGELLDPLNDLTSWLEYTEARLEIEPEAGRRADLAYSLARVRADFAGDPDGARATTHAALADDPLHGPALELAGRLALDVDDGELAERLRAEADAAPCAEWRAEALLQLADRLGSTDSTRALAVQALVEAEQALPGDRGIFESLEGSLAHEGDHEALVALRERALEHVHDPVPRYRLLMAIARSCTEHLLDFDKARRRLAEASEIEGQQSLAIEALRELVGLLEGPAKISTLTDLVDNDAFDASRHRAELARLLSEAGDDGAAIEVARAGVAAAPPRHPLRRTADRLFRGAERPRELLSLYDDMAAATDGPARGRWLQRAADLCAWELDQPEASIERLRAALAATPDAASIGWALRDQLARRREFARVLELELPSNDAVAVFRRAAALEAEGRDDDATTEYAKAADLGLSFAHVALERLLLRRGQWQELVERWGAAPEPAAPEQGWQERYRAAAIASEQLSDPSLAGEHLAAALSARASCVPALLLRLRVTPIDDPGRASALEDTIEHCDDPALRRAAQREKAHLTVDPEESLALWRAIGLADPQDVVAAVRTSVALEAAGRIREQQEWAQSMTQPADPGLETLQTIRAARRSTILGALRAAADAWENALVRPERPLLAYFELPHLYLLLDQPELCDQSLTRLTGRLPRGPLAARTSMVLAETLRESGDPAGAMRQLERASIADPTYYPALQAIAAACEGQSGVPLIDALLRAFESETRPERLPVVGVHLGRLLIDAGRVDLAREVLERVVSIDPGHLPGQLWLADVYERTEERSRLFDVLEAVAGNDEADDALKIEALSRRVDLALAEEDEPEQLSAAASALGAIAPDHSKVLEATLVIALASGDHLSAASALERLITLEDISETTRVGYLFELSTIKADKLGDVAAAIRALAEIRSPEAKEEAVRRLVELGDRSGRWDIASQALEAALDDSGELETSWELTIRRRLAALFDGPLGDREAAVRQLRRIVELDSTDVVALERLVGLCRDQTEMTKLTRLLFAARPDKHDLLDRLRAGFLELGDEDSAFTAEAVAVGVGAASEEVEYFYKQRRTFLRSGATERSLTPEELASFIPEPHGPAVAFMRAIAPALPEVFAADFSAYGVDPDRPPTLDSGFTAVITAVAELFGVEPPTTFIVASQRGPAVEYVDGSPVLLVPRPLLDAPRREQRFVLGALLFGVATRTTWANPGRVDALKAKYLAYVLSAACRVLDGNDEPSGSLIEDDIRARLDRALGPAMREAASATRASLDLDAVDTEALLLAISVAAGCTGLLAARDPAAAITASARWKRMLRDDDDALRTLIGFAVSERHQSLRSSLGLGLVK